MISTPQKTPADRVVSFLDKKGKLELMTGLIGLRGLAFGQKQQEKQQASEDAFVRRTLWGETAETKEAEDDVGGHTILGDIVQQPPVIIAGQQQSSGLGSLIGAALVGASLVGIPGAGIASYLYAKSQAEPATPDTTVIEQREDLGLGLLKLEDLKQ